MKKLKIIVCEALKNEYLEVLEREGFNNIEIRSFPSYCLYMNKKYEEKEKTLSNFDDAVLIYNKTCSWMKKLSEKKFFNKIEGQYCFSHLICDSFMTYLVDRGSYVISSSWLENWRANLDKFGFESVTLLRKFFSESINQLVFLDSKIIENPDRVMNELSEYLAIPYLILRVSLDEIALIIREQYAKWELYCRHEESKKAIKELRIECSEYAATIEALQSIASYTSKEVLIDKVNELFIMVFGAQKFVFVSKEEIFENKEFLEFFNSKDKYNLSEDKGIVFIKVWWKEEIFGIIRLSEFLFPNYIKRYLSLIEEITNLFGMVLFNNRQYEKLLESEKRLKYLGFHDVMTGLYNRAYINSILSDKVTSKQTAIFMFDIDKLKYANDNFGHAAGDVLIKGFADILKETFKDIGLASRVGGDEFLAIVYDIDDEIASLTCEKMKCLMEKHNKNEEKEHLKISASIGYSFMENDNETMEDLMRRADERMYIDKAKKKNK